MKTLTRKEAKEMIENYEAHMNISVEKTDEHGFTDDVCIMNNGTNWAFSGKQIGMRDAKFSSENALKTIAKFANGKFKAYSNVFGFNDTYQIS